MIVDVPIRRPVRITTLCIGILVTLVLSHVSAAEHSVSPTTDRKELMKNVLAGDSIVLSDGVWKDSELKFERLPGRVGAPIEIRPRTPGGVTFTGKSVFRFSGTYVTVSGFRFRNIEGVSDVVQFRTHSERHAHHCRLTNCLFEESSDFKCENESRWVSIYGTDNRVDHCELKGKKNRGTTMVVWVRPDEENHRIDHNHFGPRPELGRNGGETIRIGTSETSEFVSRCDVTDNYFFQCNGEAEIISNKSCGNTYRHNRFVECGGALTLRHGHRCTVDGNLFLGNKQRGTGGVRIVGSGHTITNNYFEGLRGDAERAAISMMNAIPDSPLNGYAPVQNALIANNTLIDCKVSVEIGVGVGKKQSVDPRDCRWIHNLFVPGKWDVARMHVRGDSFSWIENWLVKGKGEGLDVLQSVEKSPELQRDTSGMLRPIDRGQVRTTAATITQFDIDGEARNGGTFVGCDHPSPRRRDWAKPETLRPSWR